ncbi:MAG: adenosylcobinamide-GDP ribazoletransferase [Propionicimonas sp.]
MIDGLRIALGFLTVIPVRPTSGISRGQARAAMLLGPVAVLPIGVLAGLIGWGARWTGTPVLLAGVLVVAVIAMGTRGMHLDGLADTIDGLGSGPDRDKALRVMRSGDVGPMGAAGLILVLMAQVVGFAAILGRPWGWALIAVLVAGSRAALALGCAVGVPPARPGGLGALFAGSVPVWAATLEWALVAAVLTGVGVWAGLPWWRPLVGVLVAVVGGALLLGRVVRRIGGVTGDVLGALIESSLVLLVVVVAA